MKKLFVFFVLLKLSFISCQEMRHDYDIIKSFIKEVILNEDSCLNYSEFSSYLEINKNVISDEANRKYMIGLIQQHIVGLKMGMYDNPDFKLIQNSELINLGLDFHFTYADYSRVYHLISNDTVLTTFVVNDSKIISFFYNFRKKESQPLRPWLLN